MADIFTGRLREEIPAALDAFLPALLTCTSLTTLNLCDNAFGPTAAEPLESFFARVKTLQELYLQNNGMGPDAGSRMAIALARNEANLEVLVCGRNRLENGSAESWRKCFERHRGLKTIKMPQNGIRPEGIELLMASLAECRGLKVVDFQDNTFTQRGSAALANALVNWTELEELAVGDCLLSSRGAINVFEALEKGSNRKLRILRLQYNEIDSAALKALYTAIDLGLPNLEILELNGNKFVEDDASIEAINALFEKRGQGSIDELDDLEEDSDDEEDDEEDDQEEDDDKDVDNLADAVSHLKTT